MSLPINAASVILEALRPDTWYRPENAIRYLSRHTDDPAGILELALSQGWLERHGNDVAYSSQSWLPVRSMQMAVSVLDHQPVEEPTPVIEPVVSYFVKPIVRPKGQPILPHRNVTLSQVWLTLVGKYHKKQTEEAQQLYAEYQRTGNKKNYDRHKRYNFDFVTFCGSFFTKANDGIDTYAGLLALDFDKLTEDDRRRLWNDLLKDPYFETAILYDTPGGVRWVIEMDSHPSPSEFKTLQNYCQQNYSKADDTGDVSRASFLFHSPTAYLNPKYER